jgi:SAM-dependent methyltransferase
VGAVAGSLRDEFDRLAAFEEQDRFRHAGQYLPWLVGQLPPGAREVVEVGCGAGALTALLAPRVERLLALDLSPAMLAHARRRCAPWPHVELRQLDAHDWRPEPRSLDVVVSVATLHHLDANAVIPRWAQALRPGGMLLILDVLERRGLRYLPLNGLAAACSVGLRWLRTGRLRPPAAVRAAWAEHERWDRLVDPAGAREMATALLPGATVRHHLFWRYSIRWVAPV